MDIPNIVRLLKKQGIPAIVARNIAVTITQRAAKKTLTLRAHDWEYLLTPLRRAINSKQASRKSWANDPIRRDLYTNYLALMQKVRAKILQAQTLNLDGKSIPEIARERNLSGKGLHWSDWVPQHIHAAFLLEFEKMNNHPDRPRVGKRAIPFSTHAERTASETRWERLIVNINAELAAHNNGGIPEPGLSSDPTINALEEALDAAYARTPGDAAPVNWVHLLTPARQAELQAWREVSLNGLRDASEDGLRDLAQRRQRELLFAQNRRNEQQRLRRADKAQTGDF